MTLKEAGAYLANAQMKGMWEVDLQAPPELEGGQIERAKALVGRDALSTSELAELNDAFRAQWTEQLRGLAG